MSTMYCQIPALRLFRPIRKVSGLPALTRYPLSSGRLSLQAFHLRTLMPVYISLSIRSASSVLQEDLRILMTLGFHCCFRLKVSLFFVLYHLLVNPYLSPQPLRYRPAQAHIHLLMHILLLSSRGLPFFHRPFHIVLRFLFPYISLWSLFYLKNGIRSFCNILLLPRILLSYKALTLQKSPLRTYNL